MAKKKDEKDVLVVRDEKTGEISVVAGLNADDTPKRTPAKAENAQSFLQFDRHGDVLDNFFKNFFRQCKEPSRFGFYRIAADQVDSMLGVMKDLLQHPYQNKQILAPHKIDTFPYQQQVQEEMAAQKTEKQEPQKQENMEQQKEQQESPQQTQGRQGYQPINESKINWQELEDRWGVKRDDLEKSGDLTKMLHYGKSDLVKVKPTFGGESFELDARLSFKKDGEGNVSLVPHFIRKEQKLDEYKEHKFSDDDRKNLRETGNLGRVVDIVDRETGEIIPSYISIDRKTNEITDIPANKVRIPERIGKTEITKQEQDMLRAGLPVRDKLIERNDGRKFVTTLQVNVEQRGVEFVPGTGRSPRTAQTQEAKGDTSKSQAQGGANALGQMGANGAGNVNLGGSSDGFNMAAMMASMAVGGAVGQNIAGAMNNMMGGINQQTMPGAVPPPIPTVTYHVAVNGQATGPFDISVLAQMAIARQLTVDSLVWKNGMEQWAKAGTVDELKSLFTNVMPPIQTIND